ncbi:CRP-like cAMP-binding protein [Chitinophaga niastensis]|uniref:CRP-like cAMP-binding protein n=1 Tax=Chitinophaga niastensis TaxID=536980 RepID=A0A2P8HJX4_CHINA|nr:cyclic nucleotide-binding domain-containing protein [Chitinophaga niastensis]PSL46523.1 CRP-like cAMP-binding protein [Chitinophaga niastensis]
MAHLLIESILKHVTLTEEEQKRIPDFFDAVKTRRHQYLLQEGQICRYEFFVLSGCCRQFEIDIEGKENVLQFSIEGWWITDLDSMLTNKPSLFNIDVLEGQKPAADRYQELTSRYPYLEARLPQHQIAAYLGITRESLSRIRNKITKD